jgi:hypothetical protein
MKKILAISFVVISVSLFLFHNAMSGIYSGTPQELKDKHNIDIADYIPDETSGGGNNQINYHWEINAEKLAKYLENNL